MTDIAVVLPIFRARLSGDEEVSLFHLEHFLGHYSRFILCPESLDVTRPGYKTARFDDSFFVSVESYSRLLLDPAFYRRFADYRLILIYQLDCLVFSDQLADFGQGVFDYIGAPWLVDNEHPEYGFSRVGNGGFSLRRVSSCLRVLDSRRPKPLFPVVLARLLVDRRERLSWRHKVRVAHEVSRGVDWYRTRYTLNEDHFWSDRAILFDPCFQVADVATGLAFAFEAAPRYCYDSLDGRLPFGCHGWPRWDRSFWEPRLLRPAARSIEPGGTHAPPR